MTYRSDILNILQERGFLYQGTDLEELDDLCAKGPITAYVGFDATASSLHVGNLMMLMVSRWMQLTGHRMLLLAGGGTTKIGDPSGRDTQRQLLTPDIIADNIQGIHRNIAKLVTFEGDNPAILVNNAEWLDQLLYIPFLREIGVHFSVNKMLAFDSVKLRLEREQPLSFIEFNYMLLQSYDFLELHQRYGCVLQFGGSDQWGNIVCGRELVRKVTRHPVYGLTCPLLETASGQKMGKTAQGAIWLDETRISPYTYWQFWRSIDDRDVERFLKLYTLLPIAEIQKLARLQGQEINEAKRILADEATQLLHGPACLPAIHSAVKAAFSKGGDTHSLPTYLVSASQLNEGVALYRALKELQFVPSNSEGRRKIQEGAVEVNNQTLQDIQYMLTHSDLRSGEIALTLGRKNHGIVRLID